MAEQQSPSMQEVKKDNLKKAMDKFGKYLVKESRKNLTRKKKNSSKELYKSIDYKLQVMPNSINFDFLMEEYGEWVDKGRKAGTMPPVSAIEKWVKRRKIQFRDNRGRFETYNSTAWAIAKSIEKRGIPASNFYSRPFKLGFAKLPMEVTQAYALDVEEFFEYSLKELNKKYKDGSK